MLINITALLPNPCSPLTLPPLLSHSCLLRYSGRGVIVGEGKPENQNHASIFVFGEALQTIDMNQDNHLAEALKMRNLLGELQAQVGRGAEGKGGVQEGKGDE